MNGVINLVRNAWVYLTGQVQTPPNANAPFSGVLSPNASSSSTGPPFGAVLYSVPSGASSSSSGTPTQNVLFSTVSSSTGHASKPTTGQVLSTSSVAAINLRKRPAAASQPPSSKKPRLSLSEMRQQEWAMAQTFSPWPWKDCPTYRLDPHRDGGGDPTPTVSQYNRRTVLSIVNRGATQPAVAAGRQLDDSHTHKGDTGDH